MMELNKIYCGDNCDLLGQLPRECIDLVVTSPPYDDLRTYGGHTWDFYGVAWQLKRVLKPGGVIVWVVADATIKGSETGTSFKQALYFKEIGFNLHDTMIYKKLKPVPIDSRTAKRYTSDFEYMFVFSKGRIATCNYIRVPTKHGGKKAACCQRNADGSLRLDRRLKTQNHIVADDKIKGNVWEYASHKKSNHPAPFPEQLATDHILSWSNEGDTVLDPFTGSGTTCKAAKELGRNFLGFEINPEYCKIAERRIAQGVLDFAS